MPTGGFITLTFPYQGRDGGVEMLSRQFATWGAEIRDLSEPLTQIGEDLLADFALNMVTEGGFFAGQGSWIPLAASTVLERARLGYGGAHPILYRNGFLADSLASRGMPGNVFEVSPTTLRVGTSVAYSGFHQRGTRKMPRRPVVGINYNRRALLTRRMADYVRAQAATQGIDLASR